MFKNNDIFCYVMFVMFNEKGLLPLRPYVFLYLNSPSFDINYNNNNKFYKNKYALYKMQFKHHAKAFFEALEFVASKCFPDE